MKSILFLLLAMPVILQAQPAIIIRHINVVDVQTGAIRQNQLVLIKGNRIDFIEIDNKAIQKSGTVIDGTGKYLIPGLWDMHTHYRENVPETRIYKIPTMLANGVTGVRNMNGTKEDIQLRDSVNKDLLIAPREIVGSPIVNGPVSFWPGSISIKDVDQIPALVDSLQEVGYDFIKVYSFLRSDLFFALAKYCKEKKMAIAGHVPIGVTAEQASGAGLQSIEHLTGLRRSFADNGEQLSKQWEKEFLDTSGFNALANILFKSDAWTLPLDTLKAQGILTKITLNHTAVVPTIVVFRGAEYDRDSLMKMPTLNYVSKERQQNWYNMRASYGNEKGWTENAMQLLHLLHKQGVMILAGTDNENPFVVDGFSLHDELEYYVQAGFTPLEALQTATLNPAIFLHKENDLGTVTKGKLADLVILNKNPLDDIKNTKEIDAVIMNGHLISKTQIEAYLKPLENKP